MFLLNLFTTVIFDMQGNNIKPVCIFDLNKYHIPYICPQRPNTICFENVEHISKQMSFI